MNRGKYILIEGGDGSGKSTQVELLHEYLLKKGILHVTTVEPGATELGKIYRRIIKGEASTEGLTNIAELFTFLADRAQNIKQIVSPNIESRNWVISDRGFPSTFAYQGYGHGIDLGFIQEANRLAMSVKETNYFPDLTFIIKIDPQLGLEKSTDKSRFERMGTGFHKRVLEGYLAFAKAYEETTIVLPHEINNQSLTHSRIVKILEERFKI